MSAILYYGNDSHRRRMDNLASAPLASILKEEGYSTELIHSLCKEGRVKVTGNITQEALTTIKDPKKRIKIEQKIQISLTKDDAKHPVVKELQGKGRIGSLPCRYWIHFSTDSAVAIKIRKQKKAASRLTLSAIALTGIAATSLYTQAQRRQTQENIALCIDRNRISACEYLYDKKPIGISGANLQKAKSIIDANAKAQQRIREQKEREQAERIKRMRDEAERQKQVALSQQRNALIASLTRCRTIGFVADATWKNESDGPSLSQFKELAQYARIGKATEEYFYVGDNGKVYTMSYSHPTQFGDSFATSCTVSKTPIGEVVDVCDPSYPPVYCRQTYVVRRDQLISIGCFPNNLPVSESNPACRVTISGTRRT